MEVNQTKPMEASEHNKATHNSVYDVTVAMKTLAPTEQWTIRLSDKSFSLIPLKG